MSLWKKFTHVVTKTTTTVEHTVTHAATTVAKTTTKTWESTTKEGEELGNALHQSGLNINKNFITGVDIAGDLLKEGTNQVETGLVGLGNYVTAHACDIGIGSALTAVFTTLAADGEEEASFGALAATCAASTVDNILIGITARDFAYIIGEGIFAIPDVDKVIPNKEGTEDLIAFVVRKVLTEKPQLVVETAGQVVAGVVIATITSIVCEGTLPFGYVPIWKGVQHA